MKYRDIVKKSAIVIRGNISANLNIQELDRRIRLSKQLISQFDNIVITYNKDNSLDDNSFDNIIKLYRQHYPECIFLSDVNNRGWIFGGIDLTKNAYNFVRKNIDVDYIWFITDDYLLKQPFLDVDFGEEDYDFFGMPYFGYGGIKNVTEGSMDVEKYIEHYKNNFNPQFNFFIIRSDAIAFYLMRESGENDTKYKDWIKTNDREDPREFSLSTEALLGKTIKKNKLSYKIIIDNLNILTKSVITLNIHDGSHKQIYFLDYGLCHMDNIEEPVLAVEEHEAIMVNIKMGK